VEDFGHRLDARDESSRHIELVPALVSAGHEDQILIGSDTGWFDPGNASFVIEPCDQMVMSFLPDGRAARFSKGLTCDRTHPNPGNACSR
jgi:hypothetical protein